MTTPPINEDLFKYEWFWALEDDEKLLYVYLLSLVSSENLASNVFIEKACFLLSWHPNEFIAAYTGLHNKFVITGTRPGTDRCTFKILPGRYCKEETIKDKRRREEVERTRGIRHGVTPDLRNYIHKLDKYTCVYCGAPSEHIDHVIPVSKGGTNELYNLVAACANCNRIKSDRLLSELGWVFIESSRPYREERWNFTGVRS